MNWNTKSGLHSYPTMYSPDDIPVSQYGGGRSYGTAATNRGSHGHPGHDQPKVKVTKELFPVDLDAESPGSQSTQDMVDTSEEVGKVFNIFSK